jgi:general stress protein YciG
MDAVTKYLSDLGRKGGRQRAANLTDEQRAEIARKGAAVRWGKKNAARDAREQKPAATRRRRSGA